jgi:citronellol/citronellal dehydrogenase
MMGINTRGTFMVSKYCIPHLMKAENPHILMLSPPLDMKAKWFEHSTAYTMGKFGMSMCVLGLSAELKSAGVAVNALWPRTTIATAAVGNLLGGDAMMRASRAPNLRNSRADEVPPASLHVVDVGHGSSARSRVSVAPTVSQTRRTPGRVLQALGSAR